MKRAILSLILSTVGCLAQVPFSTSDVPFAANCSSLLQGCVGYWPLGETNGTRYDISGHNNNFTDNNSVGRASGKVGYAATFASSSSQGLTRSAPTTLHASKSMTVCAWVYLTNKTALTALFSRWNPTGNNREWMLVYSSSTDNFQWEFTNDGSTTSNVADTTLGSPSLSTWYFLCGTYNGTNIVLKTNNGSGNSASATATPVSATADVGIGCLVNNGAMANMMNGMIDEVGFWNRVLTASEQARLYFLTLGTHSPWAHP